MSYESDRLRREAQEAIDNARVGEDVATRSLAKVMEQSPGRCRDLMRLGDAVVDVEWTRTTNAAGRQIMVPLAVMRDGSRLTRAELRARLGLQEALV